MKKFLKCLLLIAAGIILGACGQVQTKEHEKVAPLKTETRLPENGVISKAQMATIVGKNQAFRFIGENQKINYRWTYQGQQIQNPVKQKLNVHFKTQGLDQVKKAANNANHAVGFSIEKMELAGTPELQLTIPSNWQANKAYLVSDIKGSLKKVKGSPITIENKDNQTLLRFRVLEAGVDYYIVAGGSTQEQATTEGETENQALSNDQSKQEANQQQEATPDQAIDNNDEQATENSVTTADTENPAETKAQNPTGQATNQTQVVGDKTKKEQQSTESTVTFSISARTILANWSDLVKEKQPYVPSNGWILPPTQVPLKSGDSVYDLLVRATKERGIQMESRWTPMYDAYYVSGIHQLYEFDCGNLSGWMYQVNGWFPNYGCSKYKDLHPGDEIKWEYTCDLGHDIGNNQK